MDGKSEEKEAQHQELMQALDEYAVVEAKDFELMFWEQVFLIALRDPSMQTLSWEKTAEVAANAADAACKERAARL